LGLSQGMDAAHHPPALNPYFCMKLERLKPRPSPLLDALDCSSSAWRPAFLDFALFLLLPFAVDFCTGSRAGSTVDREFVAGAGT